MYIEHKELETSPENLQKLIVQTIKKFLYCLTPLGTLPNSLLCFIFMYTYHLSMASQPKPGYELNIKS